VLVLAVGFAIYLAVTMAQIRAAAKLCEAFPAGSHIVDLENFESTFFLTRVGPVDDSAEPGTQSVLFCASMTMCETACRMEIEDRVVKSSVFSN